MWFKHLHLYRLHGAATIPAADLETALAEQAARPPAGQEARRVGWCPPAGRAGTALLHELQGQRLMTMLRHERLLPASVVREEVEERGADIEAREGRKLRRKEKQELKEQIYEEFLPQAFVRTQKVDLWWDTRRDLIAVNTSSRKRAEEALDLLRETLGSLKVTPLASRTLPMRAMTQWLAEEGSRPASLQLGDQVELKAKGDDGVLRARQVDLDSDEIQQLLAAGRQASRLGVEIEGRLGYVLHDDLTLKSLHFSDALIDEASETEDDGDAIVRLEADFMLMTQTLAEEIEQLIGWLGGEASQAASQDSA
ncbi:recombination-associated protein RdgC [Billgrantia pellis]|uniref:Recombination-associated protein RdgC n=1 Tax=Billgrantia pellis TaxID=2606936 RepID=A0A7V7G459_9GAMM|nr:recombination-associated protein RdgC [Halomonas pellis]KAA0014561.1 recombination-associated protein RdgC [Halomonas pellis]